jgi:prophage tail gpP-like protein
VASPLSLEVLGEEIKDFKSASVTYRLDQFARTFQFDLSDRWLRTLLRPLPFAEGDPCKVKVHGEVVLDGFIDDVPLDYDANTHSISISGRSWNGHMVDSSAVYEKGSWRGGSLLKIATDLALPFGVAARIDPWATADAAEPFKKYAIDDEETAFACLQRATERRGLFVTSDAGRTVVITKSSTIPHPGLLKLGANILRARRVGRFQERHSYYLVKSQRAGNATFFGEAAAGPFVRIDDPDVPIYRPLIIVADGLGSKTEMTQRASWERNTRAGRARTITYDVLGLRSDAGVAWPINQLIPVDDQYADQSGPLLIAGVTLSVTPGGKEVASLELCHPSAFDVLRPTPKRTKKRKGFGFP